MNQKVDGLGGGYHDAWLGAPVADTQWDPPRWWDTAALAAIPAIGAFVGAHVLAWLGRPN